MRSLFRVLIKTNNDIACPVLRILLAIVFFAHGAQKVLGWFGGKGLEPWLTYFTNVLHLPVQLAVLPLSAEFLGPMFLLVGFLTRVAAFGIAMDMVCVLLLNNRVLVRVTGFFMNWSGKTGGEGFEFHLLVFAIAIALIIKGSGRWSIDHLISRKT